MPTWFVLFMENGILGEGSHAFTCDQINLGMAYPLLSPPLLHILGFPFPLSLNFKITLEKFTGSNYCFLYGHGYGIIHVAWLTCYWPPYKEK